MIKGSRVRLEDSGQPMCLAHRQIKHLSHSFTLSSLLWDFLATNLVRVLTLAVHGGNLTAVFVLRAITIHQPPASQEVLNLVFYLYVGLDKRASPRLIYTGGTFTPTSGCPEVSPLAAQDDSLKKQNLKSAAFHSDLAEGLCFTSQLRAFGINIKTAACIITFMGAEEWFLPSEGHSGGKQDALRLTGSGCTCNNPRKESLLCCVLPSQRKKNKIDIVATVCIEGEKNSVVWYFSCGQNLLLTGCIHSVLVVNIHWQKANQTSSQSCCWRFADLDSMILWLED